MKTLLVGFARWLRRYVCGGHHSTLNALLGFCVVDSWQDFAQNRSMQDGVDDRRPRIFSGAPQLLPLIALGLGPQLTVCVAVDVDLTAASSESKNAQAGNKPFAPLTLLHLYTFSHQNTGAILMQ